MKQTYILKKISKLNESDMTIDDYNKKVNNLVKQITIWDDPEYLKRNKPIEDLQALEDAGANEEVEIINGIKSTNFSVENWERFKKGLPSKMPKIFLPKRLDKRNSITVYGRKIYVVKKNVNMTPISMFSAFDVKTGIQLCSSWDRDKIELFLIENLQDKIHILKEEERRVT